VECTSKRLGTDGGRKPTVNKKNSTGGVSHSIPGGLKINMCKRGTGGEGGVTKAAFMDGTKRLPEEERSDGKGWSQLLILKCWSQTVPWGLEKQNPLRGA